MTTLSKRAHIILARTRAGMAQIAELLAAPDHPPRRARSAIDRTHPLNVSRTELRKWRRERHLCTECGAELLEGEERLCAYHSFIRVQASDRWRAEHPDQVKSMNLTVTSKRRANAGAVNAKQRSFYQRRQEAKTCSACALPPLPGLKVCKKHRDQNRAKVLRYQARTRPKKGRATTGESAATPQPSQRAA